MIIRIYSEPLLQETSTLNKKHSMFNLSIKDRFCDPGTMASNTMLPLKEDNLRITVKLYQISWSQSVHYLKISLNMFKITSSCVH